MAEGLASRVLRAPSRVIVNPTDLSADAPYGGVYVGKTQSVALTMSANMVRVEDEGLGEASDILESRNQFTMGFMLRGWDDDALQQLFPGQYSAGVVSGRAIFQAPGTRKPGRSALSRGVTLLVVPEDVENVPACLMHRVVCDFTDQSQIQWSAQNDMALTIAGHCMRGSSADRILDIGRLADLSLT